MDALLSRIPALITAVGGNINDPKVVAAFALLKEYFSGMKTGQMKLLRAEFSGTYWNENINDENFLGMDANVSIEGVRPVKIGKVFTREEGKAILKAKGLKPASLDKCIRWCAANPDYQRIHWLLCLAQSWFDADGVKYVVYFDGDAQNRYAYLSDVIGRWNASNEVLAEQWVYKNVSEALEFSGAFVFKSFIHVPSCLPMPRSGIPIRSYRAHD